MDDKEIKIMVAGIGGVGGYLAVMLSKAYPHVTWLARGERKEKLEKEGLILHSELHGDVHAFAKEVKDAAKDSLEVQDYVFICVKNYSLKEMCSNLKGAVDEHTIVIPVMNGVDCADCAGKYLGKGKLVKSLIYIVSFVAEDGSIIHEGNFADIRIGTEENRKPEWLLKTENLLKRAGISCRIGEDIEAEIWKKYILNCAYNVMTALYDKSIGQLRKEEKTKKQYLTILQESYTVAREKGVQIEESYVEYQYEHFLHRLKDNATSSLQRDIRAERKSELDTFGGYLVREAKRLGMSIPVSEECYEILLKKEKGENK